MRAMVLEEPRPAEEHPLLQRDLPLPAPGRGEIRVRVRACGVCHTDLHTVEGEIALPKLPVARALWRPRPDLSTAAEAWLVAGGAHHTVLSDQLDTEVFADFADIAGIELLVIDAETRVRDFARELRWNQAYYRLAAGL